MRIGFDAFPLQRNPSGIGKYLLNMIKEIISSFPDAEYFAYSNRQIEFPDELKKIINKRQYTQSFHNKIPGKVWLKLFSWKYIKDDNLDFYISTTGFFPILSSKVKKIAVVHDLNLKLVPQTMGKLHYITHLLFFRKDITGADFVISNSKGTADKVLFYYNKKTDEIINPPVSELYYKRSYDEIKNVKHKYKIEEDYILFVGNMEPRKNLIFALKNFTVLRKQNKIKHLKFVIVGLSGWNNVEIMSELAKNPNNVKLLGYVEESDLPALYSGASVFLFPSLYEGFGIPIRESLLCGTPVITSDIVELREAGNIAKNEEMISFIDPIDNKQCQEKIRYYLNNNIKKEESENPKILLSKTINFIKKYNDSFNY